MTPEEVAKVLSEHFQDAKLESVEGAKLPVTGVTSGDPFIVVPTEKLKEICRTLKVMNQFSFDCLSNLTAVDRPVPPQARSAVEGKAPSGFAGGGGDASPSKARFEIVYHLFSYKHKHSVTLKIYLPRDDNAHIETVEDLWACANWLEREVYDLFGIKFDGHSDLRRIMLPDDWVGYPLRKDYKEEEDYHGITTTRPPLIQ